MASQEIAVAAATPMPALANELADDKLIPLARFDAAQLQQIQGVALAVDIHDSNAIMTFGAQMQPSDMLKTLYLVSALPD